MRHSTTFTLRRVVGTSALVIAAAVVPAGIAAAADYPNGGNPPEVRAQTVTAPSATTAVKASTTTSTLPFTGGDVAGLALIGAGAALAGTVLVRRSRRHADA